MLDIQITKTTSPKAKPADESKLGFGLDFHRPHVRHGLCADPCGGLRPGH